MRSIEVPIHSSEGRLPSSVDTPVNDNVAGDAIPGVVVEPDCRGVGHRGDGGDGLTHRCDGALGHRSPASAAGMDRDVDHGALCGRHAYPVPAPSSGGGGLR